MNWVTILWSMVASACLTLALMHLHMWWKRRQDRANLWFFVSATGTCLLGLVELWLMRSQTIAEYSIALRWLHVPAFLVIIALMGFVLDYMRAGRPWLFWAVFGVRTLSLVLNFVFTPNLNYRVITGLHQVPFLGDSVTVGEGIPNPWMLVGQLSFLLWAIFVIDAAWAVWRRGQRQRAVTLGGSIVFFVITGSIYAMLTLWQVVDKPVMASLFYMGVVLTMAYELSYDSAQAAQMGEDLQESKHHLELTAEAAQLGIWIRDLDTNEIRATEIWRSLFGFSRSEPLRFSLMLQRIHPDDRDEFNQAASRAVEDAGSYERDYRVVLPDGGLRWISSHGHVEVNDSHKPIRVVGISMDITQRKVAELEAQQQRSELVRLSRVTMLGELSGSIAHELNQPLTAILSNAQAAKRLLARENADIQEVDEILGDIVDQDHRAGEVIRRLRLLLKEGEVQQLPIDVNEVLQQGLKLIRNELVNKGVTLVPRFATVMPAVIGDRVQLQQVLVNLVMNACDAMVDNSPADRRVEVSTEVPSDSSMMCMVSDLGTGISPEKLEQVFNPFFTTKIHGLGLGLSVCRSIIKAHGGRLWVSNNPERGTTFHFTLPVFAEPTT